ncbi:MAG: response regulator transcription factor [Bacteroidetes bacterium]|nr:response regulator transcription factor [Bacteroidota bacterium]
MKTYNAIIIDDEYHIREAMRILLDQNCPEVRLCGIAASAEEGRALLHNNAIDLIFLDISMPREDGFDFLNSISAADYAVIFVTAFQEFALKALKANAVDYILKPVNSNELKEAVEKAIEYLEMRKSNSKAMHVYNDSISNLTEQIKTQKPCVEKITVPEQFGFRIVKVIEIMYLQADSNYTILHFSGLNKIVATRSLSDFEKILDGPDFFRIHKSTLINLRFLNAYSSYQGNFAELTDGTRLSISRRKVQEFKDAVAHISKLVE